jgi:hypothetical protein
MPVDDYGVWKVLPVHFDFEDCYEDLKSLYLSLCYYDNFKKKPQFSCMHYEKYKNSLWNFDSFIFYFYFYFHINHQRRRKKDIIL